MGKSRRNNKMYRLKMNWSMLYTTIKQVNTNKNSMRTIIRSSRVLDKACFGL